MRPNGIITLLTDFGLTDPFVGMMKGVILGIAPRATVVDLTHGVPPQSVEIGSLYLVASAPYFPDGTVHIVVVDPGVGTERRAVAVRTERAWYVTPDNGLLSGVMERERVVEAVELTNTAYFLVNVSATFHGRDVFAPVGASALMWLWSLASVAMSWRVFPIPLPRCGMIVSSGASCSRTDSAISSRTFGASRLRLVFAT